MVQDTDKDTGKEKGGSDAWTCSDLPQRACVPSPGVGVSLLRLFLLALPPLLAPPPFRLPLSRV